jgi:hypothetical protein
MQRMVSSTLTAFPPFAPLQIHSKKPILPRLTFQDPVQTLCRQKKEFLFLFPLLESVAPAKDDPTAVRFPPDQNIDCHLSLFSPVQESARKAAIG